MGLSVVNGLMTVETAVSSVLVLALIVVIDVTGEQLELQSITTFEAHFPGFLVIIKIDHVIL